MEVIEILKAVASHWALSGGLLVVVGLFVWLAISLGPTWLLAHWYEVLDALFLLVAVLAIIGLYVMLEQQRAATVKAQADYQVAIGEVRVLQSSNADLAATIVQQNKAASDAQAQSVARSNAASEAMATAKAKQAGDRALVAKLRARVANPKTNQGTCDDEIANLRAGL
jgi:hypothetical protein